MPKIHEPLTFSKHEQLAWDINEMCIDIKLHHIECKEKKDKPEEWAKAQASRPIPTWEQILVLLTRARDEMNNCRVDPRKYQTALNNK